MLRVVHYSIKGKVKVKIFASNSVRGPSTWISGYVLLHIFLNHMVSISAIETQLL